MIEIKRLVLVASFSWSVALAGCGNANSDDLASVGSAVDSCVAGAPVVTQITEEQPGAVAPGITKTYFVTVRNGNSAACAPATLFFVPDSFKLISVVATPSNIGGVASGATAMFRVSVTADPSASLGTTNIGFTVVANPAGTSVRGALVFTTTLDNPVGCNRQAPAVSIDNAQPPPVPPATAVVYHVTVRNVDNRECGADTFTLIPGSFHMFNISANGPFNIAPQGSAVFDLTVQQAISASGTDITETFTVVGNHHDGLVGTGSVRYRTQ